MIQVKNQFFLRLDIGDREDFVAESEFHEFSVIEEAGFSVPTFQLAFNCFDADILRFCHEGQRITAYFGIDRASATKTNLVVTKLQITRHADAGFFILATGFYDCLAYIHNINQRISPMQSAIEEVKTIASRHFAFESNITASKDKQKWIQASISDRKHITNCWLHGDYGDDICLLGVTADGVLRVVSVNKAFSEAARSKKYLVFTSSQKQNEKEFAYEGDYVMELQSGFLNSLYGYGREFVTYDLIKGTCEPQIEDPSPVLAASDTMVRSFDVNKKFFDVVNINENVHQNYWASYAKNISKITTMASVSILLNFTNVYVPARILDVVYFRDKLQTQRASDLNMSGFYIVSKVARTVNNRGFATTLKICRESLNDFEVE